MALNFFKKKKEEAPQQAPPQMDLPPLPEIKPPSQVTQTPVLEPAAQQGMPTFPEMPAFEEPTQQVKLAPQVEAPVQQATTQEELPPASTMPEPSVKSMTPEVTDAPIPDIEPLEEIPDSLHDLASTAVPPLEGGLTAADVPPLEDLPVAPDFMTEMMTPEEQPLPAPSVSDIPLEIPPLEGFPLAYKHHSRGPLFVRLDQYKTMLSGIEEIKQSFSGEEEAFLRISEVKNAEEKTFDRFKSSLEDVQRKLMFIDRLLFEA